MNVRVVLTSSPGLARLPRLEEGLLHVGALAQSRYWWDRFGKGRPLPRMTDEHVLKLEAMMRDRAAHFALVTNRRHAGDCEACDAMLAAPEPGYAPPPGAHELAEDWVTTTPLHRALTAEIERRGLAPLPTWSSS